jgi:hypothetical protein
MAIKNDLRSKLTTRNLIISGIILIVASNTFSWTIWNVKLHELLANIGALILVIGVLQWFFDEESRQQLIDQIIVALANYLNRRETLDQLGVADCITDSKAIVGERWAQELVSARVLVIGVHYSDSVIVRFESIINARITQNKITQILHSAPDGIAKEYLENCLSVQTNLESKVSRFLRLIDERFSQSAKVRTIPHHRVLRYSFVYTEQFIWLVFLTNTDGYEPAIPALKVSSGTPLFDFFQKDIRDLGATL